MVLPGLRNARDDIILYTPDIHEIVGDDFVDTGLIPARCSVFGIR